MDNTTRTVCITDFGAVAGDVPQTAAIQRAVDHMHGLGGGTVAVPAGTFTTGGVMLRSNVTLHLLRDAVLVGSRNLDDYEAREEPQSAYSPYVRWNRAILKAVDAENIAILGEEGSKIDGRNASDPQGEEGYRGPHAIGIHRSRNITLRGYTVVDSANWAHTIFLSQNITAENVTVLAGHDGLHFRGCDNIVATGCVLETGDDAIAGFANRNVVIRGCKINSSCSGMRFGGTNVLVEDCHFYGPGRFPYRNSLTSEEKIAGLNRAAESTTAHRTLAAITYFCDLSLPVTAKPGHMMFRNCIIENVSKFLHYNWSGNEQWQAGSPLEDIHFENVEIRGIHSPNIAYADAQVPLVMTMENVSFRFRDGAERQPFMHACHFKRIHLKNVSLPNATGPLFKTWSQGPGEIVFEDVTTAVPEGQRVVMTTEPFYSDPI
ncbi:MAG: right-handed parallel beta-helix repeat-containing protein [Phycisphaerae bacterium]|nr:right-handed parallel beta-helix repeat-containing protein [Phycisphaerae bacterium]